VAGALITSVDEPGAGLFEGGAARISFRSFSSFKRAVGSAGPGMNWHHIVEQTPGNLARFGAEALHNTSNLVRLEVDLHRKLNSLYSAKRPFITGSDVLTVRQWLSTQSLEKQIRFGVSALQNVRLGIW
jgi:hypothetical protein